jgi:carboxypeptidase D
MKSRWLRILWANSPYPVVNFWIYDMQLLFLENLVLVFPCLAKRPMILMGESYAGIFIVSN